MIIFILRLLFIQTKFELVRSTNEIMPSRLPIVIGLPVFRQIFSGFNANSFSVIKQLVNDFELIR